MDPTQVGLAMIGAGIAIGVAGLGTGVAQGQVKYPAAEIDQKINNHFQMYGAAL